MATKCARHSLVAVFLQGLRPFSSGVFPGSPRAQETRQAAIKRLTNASGYLVSLPTLAPANSLRRVASRSPRPSSAPPRAIWRISFFFFFSSVSTRRLRPRNAHRGWWRRERRGEGDSRADRERAVTFVTFSLLRFSGWFAF